MTRADILQPIHSQIDYWINYQLGMPKQTYEQAPEEHNEFRKTHDRDCILTNGNLLSDTIFSLWIPLRYTLVRLNQYSNLNKYGEVSKKVPFLSAISKHQALQELLPPTAPVVNSLSQLFRLGQTRANVIILPEQKLNSLRGCKPYYDYMPYFLSECFSGGDFSTYFHDDDSYKAWIDREHLGMFFDGEYCKRNIIDLSGSGDVKNGIPPVDAGVTSLKTMLDNYIHILEKRQKSLS